MDKNISSQNESNLSILMKSRVGKIILAISLVVLTIGLPLSYFLLKNFTTPVASWFDNAWEYRKPLTVTNSGSTKTNYDVLITVDTASLIAESKIQANCNDIRVVDSDGTTVLPYWIESGCNSSQTQIWARVPSVPSGDSTIHLYYGNGSALDAQESWGGNISMYSLGSCPTGWTQNTDATGRFLRGSASYGALGGSTTHTYGAVACSFTASGSSYGAASGGSASVSRFDHTHSGNVTVADSGNILPPYQNVVLCEAPSFMAKSGLFGIFESTPSSWTRNTDLDGDFIRVDTTAGGTGGVPNHNHSYTGSGSTTGAVGVFSGLNFNVVATGGTITTSGGYTIHTFTSSGSFVLNGDRSVEYLVVGGGGKGGNGYGVEGESVVGGGGGGAGGMLTGTQIFNAGSHTVTVGDGGIPSSAHGGNSVLGSITATGGGAGGTWGAGHPGGSGGGGTRCALGGVGTVGQGNNGGTSISCGAAGGGGRGAAGAGGGGAGLASSISGASVTYSRGGDAGGTANLSGPGPTPATPAPNLGTGGKGGSCRESNGVCSLGGNGGTGVVIVRYLTPVVEGTIADVNHTHSIASGNTTTVSNLPSYIDVVVASADSDTQLPAGAIVVSDTLPPLGWSRVSAFDGKLLRGASSYGATGGSDTHTHGISLTGSSSSTLGYFKATSVYSNTTHSNTCTLPTKSNLPPYLDVLFVKKGDNIGNGVSVSIGSEQSNAPATPTMGAGQALSTTSIRWNFVDNANNESGFKIYDMAGELKATCVGANLTYCDEAGLSPNTQYQRRVKAYNDNGDSTNFSSSTSRYTLAPTPTLSVTGVTVDSISLTSSSLVNVGSDLSAVFFDCLNENCESLGMGVWGSEFSVTSSDLNSNTQYQYRVVFRNGDGVQSAYSDTVSRYTYAPTPSLSITNITSNSLTLGVSNVSGFGNGSSGAIFECIAVCGTSGSWNGDGDEVVTGLTPNSTYEFRVKVRNGDGVETAFSESLSRYTLSALPLAPTLSEVGTNSIKVTLNSDQNGNPSGTEFALRLGNGQYVDYTTGNLVEGEVWGDYDDFGATNGVVVTGLEEGINNSFALKSRNVELVQSDFGPASAVFTSLKTPTGLVGVATGATSIRWNFVDNTLNEEGYRLYDENDTLITTCVGVNLSSCEESGLNVNTQYSRKIKAYNSNTESAFSQSASRYSRVNTPDAPTLSFGVNSVGITINSNDNPAITTYSIRETNSNQFVTSLGTLSNDEEFKTVTEWGAITLNGLSPNVSYSFVVKANNGDSLHQSTSPSSAGYTLTDTVPAPTVSGNSTTSVKVVVNGGSNPVGSTYAIYHEGSDQYVNRSSGLLQASEDWGTQVQWGGGDGIVVSGFGVNTSQSFKVKARNGDNVAGALSDTGSGYTFANPASTPTLEAISTTVVKLLLNVNSNPASTQFAVQINNGNYINHQTGLSQLSSDFATYEQWGGVEGLGISGLSPNGFYEFRVLARNGDGINSAYSSNASVRTLANVPGVPTITRISSSTANLTLSTNGNPSDVTYAIVESVSGEFVNTSGEFVQSEVWGTYAQWGGTNGFVLTQLQAGSTYEFRVKARNGDSVQTGYSATSGSYSALGAPVIATPTVLDSTTIRWNFTENLSNESGFRVFTSDGVQVAQCLGANLTYCDEYGLSPNTNYVRKISAYDDNGNGDFTDTASATTFSVVPPAPVVSVGNTPTVLNVVVNTSGNNGDTRYVISESVSGYFVNQNGELVAGEYVGSYADFGGESGVNVSSLFANAQYTFTVKAVNLDNVSTAYSSSTSKYTNIAPFNDPTVTAASENSLRIVLSSGGNPPFTQYSIREVGSNRYVAKNGGALSNSAVWGTYSEFGSNVGVLVTGLSGNTQYTFEVVGRNGNNVVGHTSAQISAVTFASRPDSVLVRTLTSGSVNVRLASRYANSTDRFAIYNSESNRFINRTGEFVTDPVWLTYAQWGSDSGVDVLGLVPGRAYTFLVKTRNSLNVETSYSQGSPIYTQALPPLKPNSTVVSTTGARVFLLDPGNDTSVLYSIYEAKSGRFVSKVDGTLTSTASWGTYAEFGGSGGFLIKGLPSASDFDFRVRARNGNNLETSFSPIASVSTNAILFNVNSNVSVVLKENSEVEVTKFEGSQRGEKDLLVKKGNLLIADIPVKFDSDKDWGSVVIDSDELTSRAVVKLRSDSGLNGKFTMYVPAGDSTRFRICPDSATLNEVTSNCNNGVLFSGNFPQSKDVEGSSVTVSRFTIDGKVYWVAQGLSGTGGIGEKDSGSQPTDTPPVVQEPEEETPPLVINIPNVDSIVNNINNQSVKNVAKVVLEDAPARTVLAMKQVSQTVDATALGQLKQPELVAVTTVATAATVTVSLAVFAGGFANLPYLVFQLILGLLSFLGFIKKTRPYGLVYDAITKKPINRAIVRIYNQAERLVWTDVTSPFGTFGANLPNGKYKILVVKPGYLYPSNIVTAKVDFPLEPVYHGEVFSFNRKNEFNLVIPMDPKIKTPFAKVMASVLSSASVLVKFGHTLLFIAGLILAVHTLYKYPSSYNLVALLFYIPAFVLLMKNIFIKRRTKGMVIDRNGNPVAGVTVTLKEMKFDKFVGKRVSDEQGEYQFIVPNGTYQLGIMDDNYRAIRYEGGSSIISRKRKAKELVVDKAIIVRQK